MRTSLLSTLLGLSLVACAGQIDSGGGDDDVPDTCGNGVVDEGEQCDGTAGCSATCTMEAVPRVDVTADKTSVTTELNTTQMITVTVKGAGGYAGNVTITPTVVDANNLPLAGWTVSAAETVTLATNGTQVVVVTVTIPTENKGLAGMLKIDATTSAVEGTHSATIPFTVENQLTLGITSNGTQCAYPVTGTVNVSEGTKIRFLNGSADANFKLVVHTDGSAYGVPHGDTTAGNEIIQNAAYERTVTVGSADGATFQWYCHSPGPDLGGGNPQFLVKAVTP